MQIKGYRIKIYTRSANIELFHYSQKLINLPYKRRRLCGTTADGYFYKMIEDDESDIVINIDEDAFVLDNSSLCSLLYYVINNNIVCCGIRDGGVLDIRPYNPIVMNPFFNIINLKAIREKYSIEDIINFDYSNHKKELIRKLPEEFRNNNGLEFDRYEPYYNFFFWIAYNFKTLYLDVSTHKDGFTTIVYNHNQIPLLYHTWWSRMYGKDKNQTRRIQNVIEEAYLAQGLKMPRLVWWKSIRRIERVRQLAISCWIRWIKIGHGRWIINHLRKSPVYYTRRIVEMGKNRFSR